MLVEFVKGIFLKPAYLLLVLGLALVLFAAVGSVSVQEQAVAVADPLWRIIIAGLGALLVAAALYLIFSQRNDRRPRAPTKYEYDVFLASPMASLSDEAAYERQRADVERIKDALGSRPGLQRIYDSGRNLRYQDWEPGQIAAEIDLEALRHSRYFMLYFPEKVASSVLFEAGYALGLGKAAVYVASTKDQLPFLMRDVESLSRLYPEIRIWECASVDDVVRRIRQSGKHIFAGDEIGAAAEPASGG